MINLRVHLPKIITNLFPSAIWSLPVAGKKVAYLTFDDGPIPQVTPKVLDILEEYGVKATFFCVGENVFKHPQVYQEVLKKGHSVGNHTYNHVKGYNLSCAEYLKNINKASNFIDSTLFRPPHGWMKSSQIKAVAKSHQLIMWDVISCDYDSKLTVQHCFNNITNFVGNGSIITFHDSLKAEKNVLGTLPQTIEYLLKEGYELKPIVNNSAKLLPKDDRLKINLAEIENKKKPA